MGRNIFIVACALALSATMASAATVNYNFETDQSSQFDVRIYNSDATANFNYDYSSYVPQSGTTGTYPIPASPSSPGTKGLKLQANAGDAVAAIASVSVFPKDTQLTSLSNFDLKFDMWPQFNGAGATGGGAGSSCFITFGGLSDGSKPAITETAPTQPFSGFFCAWSNDDGYTTDMRLYEQGTSAMVQTNSKPNWNGANETSESSAGWRALFATPTYEVAGAPGKAWTTVEMQVRNGNTVTVFVTPTGKARTQVGSWTTASTVPTSGRVTVGYSDGASSIPVPAADNFLLIDNLSVTTNASVEDYQLY